jgi:hypothetical protein
MGETRYVELELKGSADQAIGFVEGLRLGTPEVEKVWYSSRESLESGGIVEAFWRRIGKEVRVIMPQPLAETVRDALAECDVLDLEAGDVEPIDYGELEFSFHVYSRDEAEQVRRVVEDELPDGVRLDDYDVDEKVDENARGVELYSPTHHYECSGGGRYVGAVAGIFDLAHRLDGQSFIDPGKVRLHHSRS